MTYHGSWRFISLLGAMIGMGVWFYLRAGAYQIFSLWLFRDGKHGVCYSSRLFGVCRFAWDCWHCFDNGGI